jgi:hypothetical protein
MRAMDQGNQQGNPWVLRGIVIGLAVVVGIVAWVATSGGDDEPAPEPAAVEAEAAIVSEEELTEIASTAEYPVYWAGPIEGTELEVTDSGEAGVLVRYLEEGDEVGDAIADRIAIGSYPLDNPEKALDNFASQPGSKVQTSDELGEVVVSPNAPSSAYFVAPGNEVQVEVYDKAPGVALDLVLSGQVVPVG